MRVDWRLTYHDGNVKDINTEYTIEREIWIEFGRLNDLTFEDEDEFTELVQVECLGIDCQDE
jgi:hypothetical protein